VTLTRTHDEQIGFPFGCCVDQNISGVAAMRRKLNYIRLDLSISFRERLFRMSSRFACFAQQSLANRLQSSLSN
jgi:hypothetical protein